MTTPPQTSATTYLPGSYAAYAGASMLVVAAAEAIDSVAALAGPGGVGAGVTAPVKPSVLEVISALSGGDLAAVPDFACVVLDGGQLRAVVRCGFRLSSGSWSLDGRGGAPWVEQPVPGGPGATVTVSGGEPESAASRWLPLLGGVVLVSSISWSAGSVPSSLIISSGSAPRSDEMIRDDAAVGEPGDHDGLTVAASAVTSLPPAVPGPQAVLRVTGKPEVVVHRTVLIGRAPEVRKSGSAAIPALVVVDDPYVSGTHLEVIRREAMVLVIDRSSNGTLVKLPGRVAERLVKGVATPVVDGTVLTLSDQVAATIEIAPPPLRQGPS